MPLPLPLCCIPGLGPEDLRHNRTIPVVSPGTTRGWPLHLLRGNSAYKNLQQETQRRNCCLYEMPYYVAAPIRETGDVIAHLQEPDFFFGSQVTRFSRDPSCYSIGSHIFFPQGSHMQEQYHQWTTQRTWNPNSCLKIRRPLGLTLRCMPYGRGTLRIPLWRFS
jgi:hypothetical protein